MPRIKAWSDYYGSVIRQLADHFVTFPEGVDQEKLSEVQERINKLWISEDGTWPEFQRACGELKMIFWKVKS